MSIINLMSGVKAKGFASTGGVVSPSYRKKKLSCKFVVIIYNIVPVGGIKKLIKRCSKSCAYR